MNRMKKVFGVVLIIGGLFGVGCSSPSSTNDIKKLEVSNLSDYVEQSSDLFQSNIANEPTQNLSEDALLVKGIAEKFAQAYFTQNVEMVDLYVDKDVKAEVYSQSVWDELPVFNLKWNPEKITSDEKVNL